MGYWYTSVFIHLDGIKRCLGIAFSCICLLCSHVGVGICFRICSGLYAWDSAIRQLSKCSGYLLQSSRGANRKKREKHVGGGGGERVRNRKRPTVKFDLPQRIDYRSSLGYRRGAPQRWTCCKGQPE